MWISGNTLWHRALYPLARRKLGTAILHLGAARFKAMPFLRYSMSAADAVRAVRHLGLRSIYPVHFEGWTHFVEGRHQVADTFARLGVPASVHWLERGERTSVEL